MRVLVFLNVIILIFTYPLTINPANSTLENMTVDKWFPRSGPKRRWAKNISRFLICFSAAYLGIELSDYLDKVIGLLGAVLCAPLALMLPTLCHFKLLAHKRGQKVSINRTINASTASTIKRSVFLSSPTSHERSFIDGNRRTKKFLINAT